MAGRCGALLGLVASLIDGARPEDPNQSFGAGPRCKWAVDRDAQEVCGLDEDLVSRKSVGSVGRSRSARAGMEARGLRSSLGNSSSPLPARSNPGRRLDRRRDRGR